MNNSIKTKRQYGFIFIFSLIFSIIISVGVSSVVASDQFKFILYEFIIFVILFSIGYNINKKTLNLDKFIVGIISVVLATTSFSFFNIILSHSAESYKVMVISKGSSSGKNSSYWLKVTSWRRSSSVDETIYLSRTIWNDIEEGSEHVVKTKKSFFGIERVIRFY
jgi:hypothetical protein